MAKNYFKSYIWLLETLQSRGPQTLKEIKDLWMRSAINEDGKELQFGETLCKNIGICK